MTQTEGRLSLRRTEQVLDVPAIEALCTTSTSSLFGDVRVSQLIEESVLCITGCISDTSPNKSTSNEVVVGFAGFCNSPSSSVCLQGMWEPWIRTNYGEHEVLKTLSPLNTLFIRLCAVTPSDDQVAYNLVKGMFRASARTNNCLLVVPRETSLPENLSSIFKEMPSTTEKTWRLYICKRTRFSAPLTVRLAKVEDHDDLVPIFQRQSEVLTDRYGEFFLAELIESQTQQTQALVAEVGSKVVGFISLSSNVDVNVLRDCFDLDPYDGLRSVPFDEESIRRKKDNANIEKSDSEQEEKEKIEPPENNDVSKVGPPLTSTLARGSSINLLGSLGARSKVNLAVSVDNLSSSTEEQGAATVEEPPEDKKIEEPVIEWVDSAFCVCLFCIDEAYEARAHEFLTAAFKLYPEKDYCVLTLPHKCGEFPFLRYFARATAKPGSALPHELYVFHKFGLLPSFSVRAIQENSEDENSVKQLVKGLPHDEVLLRDVRESLAIVERRKKPKKKLDERDQRRMRRSKSHYDNDTLDEDNESAMADKDSQIYTFLATVENQVVGVCVVRPTSDADFLRAHYNIENFIIFEAHSSNSHANLHHFALNPAFAHYAKHFAIEVLRLLNMTCMYYRCYSDPELAPLTQSPVPILSDMVQVTRRRQIMYAPHLKSPVPRIPEDVAPFALSFFNCKLAHEPKLIVNARIVVVGASDTGISFLESLVFRPHLHFSNLTLISEHGLPSGRFDSFRPTSHCFNDTSMQQMGLSDHIAVIRGIMVGIDRRKKIVTMNDGSRVYYDSLIIATGLQFHVLDHLNAAGENMLMETQEPENTPSNLFTINDENDSESLTQFIEKDIDLQNGKVVVLGTGMDAMVIVSSLISHGIPGTSIVMCESLSRAFPAFRDVQMNRFMEEFIKSQGIERIKDVRLQGWDDLNDPGIVKTIFLAPAQLPEASSLDLLSLPCSAVICADVRSVRLSTHRAMSDACLVLDGALVIDARFRTNDPYIFAAGPVTKFARKYHAHGWSHALYNSREVGQKLSQAFLPLYDPLSHAMPRPEFGELPVYVQAKVIGAVLANNYTFLEASSPSLPKRTLELAAEPTYGRDLVTRCDLKSTGTSGTLSNYYRLHIDQHHTIRSIVVLDSKIPDINNIICLHGQAQRTCNELVSRYDEGLISDFGEFFRGSWAMALFHDRFNDFRREIEQALEEEGGPDFKFIQSKLCGWIDGGLQISIDDMCLLRDEFAASSGREIVMNKLFDFLKYNAYHLQLYQAQKAVHNTW